MQKDTSFIHQQLIAAMRQRGVVALQCEACGCKHGLARLGYGCNAAHPSIDGETCESWDLREVTAGEGTVAA